MKQKKDVIPELSEKYNEWKAKHDEANAAESQRSRLEELKGELAWAFVDQKEKVKLVSSFSALN